MTDRQLDVQGNNMSPDPDGGGGGGGGRQKYQRIFLAIFQFLKWKNFN